jgi:ribosome-binding protein aMBF1 (putative translation factor)
MANIKDVIIFDPNNPKEILYEGPKTYAKEWWWIQLSEGGIDGYRILSQDKYSSIYRKKDSKSAKDISDMTTDQYIVYRKQQLAEKISTEIKRRGWTQTQFSIAMSQKVSSTSKMLKGNHNFTLKMLMKIEHVLEIELI